jgi:hypothetical protein
MAIGREPEVHREPVETDKYIAAVARMIRAAGRRAGEGDEVELRALLGLESVLEEAIVSAVEGQRLMGRSWAYVALATGRSREAAFKRWGKRVAS